jgi:hypothetical protein
VQMVGAPDIVARNDGDKGGCAIGASGLHTAECVGLDGRTGAVAVALGLDACVDTGRIASPELNESVRHGLATRRIDYIDVEMGDGALLTSEDVFTNQLTSNPW